MWSEQTKEALRQWLAAEVMTNEARKLYPGYDDLIADVIEKRGGGSPACQSGRRRGCFSVDHQDIASSVH